MMDETKNNYEDRIKYMRNDYDKAIHAQKQQIGETEDELAGMKGLIIFK